MMRDTLGAFCTHDKVSIPGSGRGPLAGLSFAAKDLFDVAGHVCCAGNRDWLASHVAAEATAPVIRMLIDAGASLSGKTILDELAYGLTGENAHYGTPINPRAPDRVPGGSSSGSASAVAGGLVDFALGTDTGGSGRVPASYCGIYGMRPTYGRIPTASVVPLAPGFDTVAWFARDPLVMRAVGEVLLASNTAPRPPRRLLIADDAFAVARPAARDLLLRLAAEIDVGVPIEHVELSTGGLDHWVAIFRTIQAREAWTAHGGWIQRVKPKLSLPVQERFTWASQVTQAQAEEARQARKTIAARLDSILRDGSILCLPTSCAIAPIRGQAEADRLTNLKLTCIAVLGGLPQISLPLGEIAGCPVGLSLAGAPGTDETLLAIAQSIANRGIAA